jgi:putative protein kinase ArgK-like GTPase of G3E family
VRYREQSDGASAGRQRSRQQYRLRELIARRFLQQVERALAPGELDGIVDAIAARELDPYSAADAIMERVLGRGETRTGEGGQP